jgi:hypothetical protein
VFGTGADGNPIVESAQVDQSSGKFSQEVAVPRSTALGSYQITATCAGTTIGVVQLQVLPLLPLSRSNYWAEQIIALLVLVALVAIYFIWRQYRRGHPAPAAGQQGAGQNNAAQGAGTAGPTAIVGQDNRTSTSKFIALIWTVIVLYGVLTLGFIAISGDQVGLLSDLLGTFPGVYLVLLGGPFAALVGARVINTNIVPSRQQKPPAAGPSPMDIVADDEGNIDLVDTQYTLFNLAAAVVVLGQFIHRPGFGAPEIPWFLAALTGSSAATYLANKALSSNSPSISAVVPNRARVHQQVAITGTNLWVASAPADAKTTVTVNGQGTVVLDETSSPPPTDTQIVFDIPAPSTAGYGNQPLQVAVQTNGGAMAVANAALTVAADDPRVVRVTPTSPPAGTDVTVSGNNLFAPGDLDYTGSPKDNTTSRRIFLVDANTAVASAPLTLGAGADDQGGTVTIPGGANGIAAGTYFVRCHDAADASQTFQIQVT